MKFETIHIEGGIFSPDILEKLESADLRGQSPKDFGFDAYVKMKDEIARAWSDAQDQYLILMHQREKLGESGTGASETRRFWIIPFLGMLGYEVDTSRAEIVQGNSYAISHRAENLDGFPVHIMGFNDSLDKKRSGGGPRLSPHSLVQEYINLKEEYLYAIVTNGLELRLLRDSSRLSKLSYIGFDLERMMEEGHFADFAIMYRLIHASRMPQHQNEGAESLIESYHQDSLESGTRIRAGLSFAVEDTILTFANGFLQHKENTSLREQISEGRLASSDVYGLMLKLIYRLLFLFVIEERNLIYPEGSDRRKRDIYYRYFGMNRLRELSASKFAYNPRHSDLWIGLLETFHLFESSEYGQKLDISPLAGGIFAPGAIGVLSQCSLDNATLLKCFQYLGYFINPMTHQKMRINYAALNVEEFGSVYEGLLEYDANISTQGSKYIFGFIEGDARSRSGSHYTPDELVAPLIKHSLDHLIEDKKKEDDPEQAILSLNVCDPACGSGHILLNAARRIGFELARIRTGEDQPNPRSYRAGIRDAIQNCIYGVDKNPLAVDLCKVALWLEAHNPGEPLHFLDHRIKCGDSIVGVARIEDLMDGIPDEAFNQLPGQENTEIRKIYAASNKQERKSKTMTGLFSQQVKQQESSLGESFMKVQAMPETNPDEIEKKKQAYEKVIQTDHFGKLEALANIRTGMFFIPKDEEHKPYLWHHGDYREFMEGSSVQPGRKYSGIQVISIKKNFFHWFLAFPEVFSVGGFDTILGNPPFLGGKKISTNYGDEYLSWIKGIFKEKGSSDLAGYFFRRAFEILRLDGFVSFISTNTIAQGDTRKVSLEVIIKNGGDIVQAIKTMPWPGLAAVFISIVTIMKGNYKKEKYLNNIQVNTISSYLDDSEIIENPYKLKENKNKCFIGSVVLGTGFILSHEEGIKLLKDEKNINVIFPYLNGDDLNKHPKQEPSRYVINFFDWKEEFCRKKFPECFKIVEKKVKPERLILKDKGYRDKWWQYGRRAVNLYNTIKDLNRVLVVAQTSKSLSFCFEPNEMIFSMMCVVFGFETYEYFAGLQSSFHFHWCYKYGSTMKTDLRYTPSTVFESYPFPNSIQNSLKLLELGEHFYQERSRVMVTYDIGLTNFFNIFHLSEISLEKSSSIVNNEADLEQLKKDIQITHELYIKMDEQMLVEYGWDDIDLNHDFFELDFLPESDNIRFTICPDAQKEILKRLLLLNHERHEEEEKSGFLDVKKSTSKSKTEKESDEQELF